MFVVQDLHQKCDLNSYAVAVAVAVAVKEKTKICYMLKQPLYILSASTTFIIP